MSLLIIDEVHVYVSDLSAALRFYIDGLGMRPVRTELGAAAGYALLEPSGGGALLRLFGGNLPRDNGGDPQSGRVGISFSITVGDLEALLGRALSLGGRRVDEIEQYAGLRVVTLADPDGNAFELVEAQPESPTAPPDRTLT